MPPNMFIAGLRRVQFTHNRALGGIFSRYQWLSFPGDENTPTPPPGIKAIWSQDDSRQSFSLFNQPAPHSQQTLLPAAAVAGVQPNDQVVATSSDRDAPTATEASAASQPSVQKNDSEIVDSNRASIVSEESSANALPTTAKAQHVTAAPMVEAAASACDVNEGQILTVAPVVTASPQAPTSTAVAVQPNDEVSHEAVKHGFVRSIAHQQHNIEAVLDTAGECVATTSGQSFGLNSTADAAVERSSLENIGRGYEATLSVETQQGRATSGTTAGSVVFETEHISTAEMEAVLYNNFPSIQTYVQEEADPRQSGRFCLEQASAPPVLSYDNEDSLLAIAQPRFTTETGGPTTDPGSKGKKQTRAAKAALSKHQKMDRMSDKQLTSFIIHKLYEPADKAIKKVAQHSPKRFALVERYIRDVTPVLTLSGHLNTIHVAAALTRLAYLVRDNCVPVSRDTLPGMQALQHHVMESTYPLLPACSDAQSLTNILWASSKLKLTYSDEFLNSILGKLEHIGLDIVSPQGLANALYSLANIGTENFTPSKRSLDALAHQVACRAAELGPQDISNIVWAFGTFGLSCYRPSNEVLNSLAGAALQKLDGFIPQGVALMLWGYAKLECDPLDGLLFDVSLRYLEAHIADIPTQEFVNTIWGVAKVGHTNVDLGLLRKVEHRAAQIMPSMLPLQLSALLGSFKDFQYTPCSAEFVGALEKFVQQHIMRHHAQELSNVMNALGSLQVQVSDATLSLLRQRQQQLMATWEPRVQNVLNFMHGYAMLREVTEQDLRAVEYYICTAGGWPQRDLMEFELHQYHSLTRLCGYPNRLFDPQLAASPLAKVAWQAWVERRLSCQPTSLDADVVAVLNRLDLEYQPKFVSPQGQLVDVALFPRTGGKIALDVCGPKEYSTNVPLRKGDRVLRQRVLELDGWSVAVVPFYAWNRLDSSGKEQFLVDLLEPLVEQRMEMYA